MKVIYNRIIPFKGFKCINLFGILFVRKGCLMSRQDLNHEAIHTAQMRELGYLPFYLLYLMEWVWHLLRQWDCKAAYHAISHEREAYDNQQNLDYLKTRKPYNQWH